MRTCDLFDKYRDKELVAGDRSEFEVHLAACEECRTKKALLDNIVHLIRSEEVRPLDLADRIARQAFQQRNSWASDVISWLRPAPALVALTLIIVLFSFLWMVPGNRAVSAYFEYETLVEEADAVNLDSRVSEVRTDSELVLWLEQEGDSQ